MNFIQMLKTLRETLSSGAGADLSFGQPIKLNELEVIPVAKVLMAVGGGSSGAKKEAKTSSAGGPDSKPGKESGGAGGQVSTTPLGIYVFKQDKVSFFPLIGIREMLMISLFSSLAFTMLFKSFIPRRKGR